MKNKIIKFFGLFLLSYGFLTSVVQAQGDTCLKVQHVNLQAISQNNTPDQICLSEINQDSQGESTRVMSFVKEGHAVPVFQLSGSNPSHRPLCREQEIPRPGCVGPR